MPPTHERNSSAQAPSKSESSAVHVDLHGAPAQHRFRPSRLEAKSLYLPVSCRFSTEDGQQVHHGDVIDLSPTGFAVSIDDRGFQTLPGAMLSGLSIKYGETTFFEGTGQVVYQVGGTEPRCGVRVLSGVLDLPDLTLRDSLTKDGLDHRLRSAAHQFDDLPSEWRSAVGDLASLLLTVKAFLLNLDASGTAEGSPKAAVSDAILRDLAEEWSPTHLSQVEELTRLSTGLSEEQIELGRVYAQNLLVHLYYPGSLYRQAITKPRGYAGDYEIMLIYNKHEPNGETSYERFMDIAGKMHTLSQTVVARQRTVAEEIKEALSTGASRFVSLACGPAIELGFVFDEALPPDRDVTFVLIDQDEDALAYCHETLHRQLMNSDWDPSRTKIECLHLSVRQLLKPKNSKEERIGEHALSGADMLYSMGLFDYLPELVARRLLMQLYKQVRPGGEVFVGNLVSEPNTTWLMDFVLGWHLLWRNEDDMIRIADGLKPSPAAVSVKHDPTKRCLFLRVARPSS